jgi:hypothetical protein
MAGADETEAPEKEILLTLPASAWIAE